MGDKELKVRKDLASEAIPSIGFANIDYHCCHLWHQCRM
jgi:hypothetical protein